MLTRWQTLDTSDGLKRNLLSLHLADTINGLELGDELFLERVVVVTSPSAMLLEGLRDAHLEVHAATAHLARHLCLWQCLDLWEVLSEQGLASFEGLGITRATRRARGVLATPESANITIMIGA